MKIKEEEKEKFKELLQALSKPKDDFFNFWCNLEEKEKYYGSTYKERQEEDRQNDGHTG